MTMLAVQLFLLLLAAFLAGAILACFLRRTFFARSSERADLQTHGTAAQSATATAAASMSQAPSAEMMPASGASVSRFGRALTDAPDDYSGRTAASSEPKVPGEVVPVRENEPHSKPAPDRAQESAVSAAAAAAAGTAAAVQKNGANGATGRSEAAAGDPRAQAAASPAFDTPSDDLTLIRSIDGDLAVRLSGLGVRRFSEIAVWSADDVNRISQSLGLTGRIKRESWIEQAQILAKGGSTDYQHRRHGASRRFIWDSDLGAKSAQTNASSAGDSASVSTSPSSQSRDEDDRTVSAAPTGMAALIAAASTAAASSAAQATEVAQVTQATAAAMSSDAAGLVSVRSEALVGMDAAGLARAAEGDDLKRIRGIGVLIETRLNAKGIRSFDQIANWSQEDVSNISHSLDFKGRIERENWIEQARILASGGETDFSRRVYRN